jgi:hypothetical protein
MPIVDTKFCYIESALAGLVLEVKDGIVAQGNTLHMSKKNGNQEQQWTLSKMKPMGGEVFFRVGTANPGDTPLLVAVKYKAPVEMIKLLAAEWPEGVKWKTSSFGSTPLHCAVEHNAAVEVLEFLRSLSDPIDVCTSYLQQGPAMNMTEFATWFGAHNDGSWVKETNEEGGTLLQLGMYYKVSVEVIRLLIDAYSESVKAKDKFNHTPLHFAIMNNMPVGVIQLLMGAWSEGAEAKDIYIGATHQSR